MLKRVISGGQTGADRGGLRAAKAVGLETGGYLPKGCRTEEGPKRSLLRTYGMIECKTGGYPTRTRRNVEHSDGTVQIACDFSSGGEKLTSAYADELGRPVHKIGTGDFTVVDIDVDVFVAWLKGNKIKVLNVAGNTEKHAPGIALFTRRFLMKAFKRL